MNHPDHIAAELCLRYKKRITPLSFFMNFLDKKLRTALPAFAEKRIHNSNAWTIQDSWSATIIAPDEWSWSQAAQEISHEVRIHEDVPGSYLNYVTEDFFAYYAITGSIWLNGTGSCMPPNSMYPLWVVFRLHHSLCAGSGREYEDSIEEFYRKTPCLEKAGFLFSPASGGNIAKEVPLDLDALAKGYPNFDTALAPLEKALDALMNVHAAIATFVNTQTQL